MSEKKGEQQLRIGLINGCSPQHIIVRADEWKSGMRIPRIGTPVLDANLKEFGSISDVFGPVSHPFFSINPKMRSSLSSFAALVGEPVYTKSADKRKKYPKKKQLGSNSEQIRNRLLRSEMKGTKKSSKQMKKYTNNSVKS